VIFGTGKYISSQDVENMDTQSLYGIWDWAHDDMDTMYYGARIDSILNPGTVEWSNNYWNTYANGVRKHTLLRQETWFEGNLYEDLNGDGALTTEEDVNSNGVNDLLGYYRMPSNFKGNWKSDFQAVSFDINKDGVVDANDRYRFPLANVGWYYDLPGMLDITGDKQDNDGDALVDEDTDGDGKIDEYKLGERVINDTIIRDNKALILSFGVTGSRCNAGAYSFFNSRDPNTGGMPSRAIFDINGDGEVDDKDRKLMQDPVTGEDILATFTDKAFDGRQFNPIITREEDSQDDDPEETYRFGNSSGAIDTLVGEGERLGVTFWQEVQ
jgi:Tfp pilus tip-associated adhesin PilY1